MEKDSEGETEGWSTESKWVYGNDVQSQEGDAEWPRWMSEDGDGNGNAEQRLIRTEPILDSFDVEAMEVPSAQKFNPKETLPDHRDQGAKWLGPEIANGYLILTSNFLLWPLTEYLDPSLESPHSIIELTMGHTLRLAFQTLGVVYGDVGTSPLYVFSGVFSKAPIHGDEDVLGALSLVLYTLALIPLIKYAFIVLQANDNGEGGTFALYSLICRYAKVSLLPNQEPSDAHISSFKLKLPTPELERSLRIKESLEKHSILKTLLLLLVLAGASMLIGDGILTPAISGFTFSYPPAPPSIANRGIVVMVLRGPFPLFLLSCFDYHVNSFKNVYIIMSAMSGLKEAVPGCGEGDVITFVALMLCFCF
eukprot:Gb_11417 [translate_table: standard]